ncbi:MAG: encapsulin, partial [Planctomycetes bacterium]|nr:encapsulin [Planctomycetota bacterium]
VKGMVDGKIFRSSRIEKNHAALVYCDANNMDLVIGQDMITAYLGNEGLDHAFRVMETVVPRIKRPTAIAVIG